MKVNGYIYDKNFKVEIEAGDHHDVSAMLSRIIHPLLINYKEHAYTIFEVDNKDLPFELRKDNNEPNKETNDWLLDELIWTFDQLSQDNCDDDGRITKNLLLFGKYFRGFWD